MVDRKTRLELNALSKDVFGVSSKWQKLVEKGYAELITKEVTETVPPEKEGDEPTTKTSQVPVLTESGGKQSIWKRHTVESVREFMLERKKTLDVLRELLKKQHEEKLAKAAEVEQAKKLNEENAGNAAEA